MNKGFTLLELLLANVIIAILVGVVSLFYSMVLKNYDFSMTQFRLTEDADLAVRRMKSELRQAQEADQGAYPLAILEDNQLAFYADADNDNVVERLRYWVQNGNLMRGVIVPSGNPPQYDLSIEKTSLIVRQVVTGNYRMFTYYNTNWPGDTVNNPLVPSERALSTRLIKIYIPITLSNTDGAATHSAEVTVQLRNLKNNL